MRLVRSKGVGVYFVTQNPLDIPDTVLAQLGNRVQHALRAFTPRDQKAVKAAASTMRANPKLDIETAITELAVGEALVSFLDEKGRPSVTERVYVLPPGSQIGPITPEQRKALIAGLAGGRRLREDGGPRIGLRKAQGPRRGQRRRGRSDGRRKAGSSPARPRPTRRRHAGRAEGPALRHAPARAAASTKAWPRTAARSAVRSMGSAVGREIFRGVLGGILGGGSKRR